MKSNCVDARLCVRACAPARAKCTESQSMLLSDCKAILSQSTSTLTFNNLHQCFIYEWHKVREKEDKKI